MSALARVVQTLRRQLLRHRREFRRDRDESREDRAALRRLLETHVREQEPATNRKVNACIIICCGIAILHWRAAIDFLADLGVPANVAVAGGVIA